MTNTPSYAAGYAKCPRAPLVAQRFNTYAPGVGKVRSRQIVFAPSGRESFDGGVA